MGKTKKLSDYWINIALLTLAVFLVNAWVTRHFGEQWKTIVWTNVIVVLTGIFGFFTRFFSESDQTEFRSKTRAIFYTFLSRRFLIAFYVIFFLIASFFTSVTIMADGARDKIKVDVTAEGKDNDTTNIKQIEDPNDVVRFYRFVSPFGSSFYVTAEGYARKSFEVYPWVGKKIRVKEDLDYAPTLWIRIPSTLINTLLDRSRLFVITDQDTLYKVPTEPGFGSVVIGRPQTITEEQLRLWEREASAYFSVDGSELNQTLIGWSAVKQASNHSTLKEGMRINIVLQHLSGKKLAGSNHIIGDDDLIDILLK